MTPSNRARLLVLLSFAVVIGIAFAFQPRGAGASDLILWLFPAEVAFVIGVFVNAYRQEHHLTWREVAPRILHFGVAYVVIVGGAMIVAWLFVTIREHWQTVGPILVVIGVGVAGLAIALLVIYLVVRVVRVAWKGR